MPPPQKEHEWLQQLVGEWTSEWEASMPDSTPVKFHGTESVRAIGGFWVLAEGTNTMPDMLAPMLSELTLGYDPAKGKYVGTWVDSMTSYLWTYQGSVDEAGKVLTLDTEGPCPMKGGQMTKFKEVLEIKSKDEKVFTSSIQEDNGAWTKMLTIDYKRKK
ncbi:MAG: DUF1579 domain-containing protein [Candidatus Hydrogenedentes bacterium]|nr:DUF1579 domain-containing protein [Candidatus Hydrogenedentota bacterium]